MVFSRRFRLRRSADFDLKDAASIGIIGAADGPTAILVSQVLGSNYMGPIAVVAYSYMALVPIIQPAVIKLITTKKERAIHMDHVATRPYQQENKNSFPDYCYNCRGSGGSDVRESGRRADVR